MQAHICLNVGGDVDVHALLSSFSIIDMLGRFELAAYAGHESGLLDAMAGN